MTELLSNTTFQAFVIAALMALVLWLAVVRKMLQSPEFKQMSLEETMQAEAGYSIKEQGTDALLGKSGVAYTDMNISGRIDIEGQLFDAISRGEFIEKGTPIKIIENRGNYFVVVKAPLLEA